MELNIILRSTIRNDIQVRRSSSTTEKINKDQRIRKPGPIQQMTFTNSIVRTLVDRGVSGSS
jgi:hypothetical protein